MYISEQVALFQFHHVGCVVKKIEESLGSFRPFCRRVSAPVSVSSQNVTVCFVETQPGTYIELVEADADGSPIEVMLKRGISFYHVGFVVQSFDEALSVLAEHSYRLLHTFSSEAFAARRCAFLMSETMQLVEIIEAGHDVMAGIG